MTLISAKTENTDGVNRKREERKTRGRTSTTGLVGHKYEPWCVQVSSDHSPDNMRLLALLLMIGAAGKERQKYILTHMRALTQPYMCTVMSAIKKK